jgi:hypothetical protein
MTTLPPNVLRAPFRERSFRAAIIGSVAVVAVGSAAQLVNYAFGLGMAVLDASEDGGAFGVVGDLAACSAAAAAWLVLIRARPLRPAAVALPPLLTFIALDKIVRLHDHVPHYLVLYAPLLVGAGVCLVDLVRRMPRSLARVVMVGLVLLGVSFLLHAVGERVLLELGLTDAGWARQVKAVVKHGCEVQGWFLVAIGLAFHGLSGRWRRREARGPG